MSDIFSIAYCIIEHLFIDIPNSGCDNKKYENAFSQYSFIILKIEITLAIENVNFRFLLFEFFQ